MGRLGWFGKTIRVRYLALFSFYSLQLKCFQFVLLIEPVPSEELLALYNLIGAFPKSVPIGQLVTGRNLLPVYSHRDEIITRLASAIFSFLLEVSAAVNTS